MLGKIKNSEELWSLFRSNSQFAWYFIPCFITVRILLLQNTTCMQKNNALYIWIFFRVFLWIQMLIVLLHLGWVVSFFCWTHKLIDGPASFFIFVINSHMHWCGGAVLGTRYICPVPPKVHHDFFFISKVCLPLDLTLWDEIPI